MQDNVNDETPTWITFSPLGFPATYAQAAAQPTSTSLAAAEQAPPTPATTAAPEPQVTREPGPPWRAQESNPHTPERSTEMSDDDDVDDESGGCGATPAPREPTLPNPMPTYIHAVAAQHHTPSAAPDPNRPAAHGL